MSVGRDAGVAKVAAVGRAVLMVGSTTAPGKEFGRQLRDRSDDLLARAGSALKRRLVYLLDRNLIVGKHALKAWLSRHRRLAGHDPAIDLGARKLRQCVDRIAAVEHGPRRRSYAMCAL